EPAAAVLPSAQRPAPAATALRAAWLETPLAARRVAPPVSQRIHTQRRPPATPHDGSPTRRVFRHTGPLPVCWRRPMAAQEPRTPGTQIAGLGTAAEQPGLFPRGGASLQ